MLIDLTFPEKSFREISENFLEIFAHRWEWIYAESLTEKGKAAWKTINRRTWRFSKERELPLVLTDEKLLELWKSEHQVVGVGFGKKTKYLMLDIDVDSPYHPSKGAELQGIKGELEDIGLISSFAVQSSNSGGIHVYYPFSEEVGSYALARTVAEHLIAAGYEVANGKLEIFPNRKALGKREDPTTWAQYQRHRLPLQQGSVVLDKDYEPDSSMLSVFIRRWEFCASSQDHEALSVAMYGRKSYKNFKGTSTGLQPIKAEYENLLKNGFTAAHQTNDILIQLGRQTRILEGYGGIELRDRLIELVTELPNYGKYCQHKEDINQRCQDIARWAERRFSPAGSKTKISEPLPLPGKNNEEKKQDAIQRIKQALAEVLTVEEAFKSKTSFLKAIAKIASSSMSTLTKYWQKLLEPIFSKHHNQKIITEKPKEISNEIVCNSSHSNGSSHSKPKNQDPQIACNPLPSKESSDFNQKPHTKHVGRSPKPLVEINNAFNLSDTKKSSFLLNQSEKKNSVEVVVAKLRRLQEKISKTYGENPEATEKKEISGAYELAKRKIPRWLSEYGLHRKYWYLHGMAVPENGLAEWWILANKAPQGTPPEKLELVEVDVPVPK
ncbi:hypothetical protein NIES208_08420 (plasmid) [[Limnothrix rosea] IAM M-220]|nr:hypothetical protein NIES208_08420 [[Limnothrix rosea] IAM M-220]